MRAACPHGDPQQVDPTHVESALVVRLAFGAGADLDLFVSDPQNETVYFANTRTRAGGRLAADVRCETPPPRIETIRFEHPLPGRYRVGIDYPAGCDGEAEPAVYVVEWHFAGHRRQVQGLALPFVFSAVAAEFELGTPPRREKTADAP